MCLDPQEPSPCPMLDDHEGRGAPHLASHIQEDGSMQPLSEEMQDRPAKNPNTASSAICGNPAPTVTDDEDVMQEPEIVLMSYV